MKAEHRTWMYRAGEARIFEAGETIPHGWVDSPAKTDPQPAPFSDENDNAIPDDWESLPWFSLRQKVEEETGIRPKTKAEAIELMKAR